MKIPSLAMASPSVRTVIVGAYPSCGDVGEPEVYHEILDVVAFRTICVEDVDDDWSGQNDVLAWCDSNSQIVDEREINDRYLSWKLVVCPWPPDEDEARLAPTVELVKRSTARRMKETGIPTGAAP